MEGDIFISIKMDQFKADTPWDGIKGYVANTVYLNFYYFFHPREFGLIHGFA